MEYKPPQPLQGALLGIFGDPRKRAATHALVVNLDYKSERVLGVRGPRKLELFAPTTREWKQINDRIVAIKLSPGAGMLIRLRR